MVLCSLQTLSSSQLFLTVSRELAFNFLSLKHLHNESSEASVTSTSASFQTESTEDQKKIQKSKAFDVFSSFVLVCHAREIVLDTFVCTVNAKYRARTNNGGCESMTTNSKMNAKKENQQ